MIKAPYLESKCTTYGHTFGGMPIHSFSATNLDDCYAECLNHDDCLAVILNWQSKECQLRDALPQHLESDAVDHHIVRLRHCINHNGLRRDSQGWTLWQGNAYRITSSQVDSWQSALDACHAAHDKSSLMQIDNVDENVFARSLMHNLKYDKNEDDQYNWAYFGNQTLAMLATLQSTT